MVRHADPIRAQRATCALTDPFLQFHYAILEPYGSLLRDRDPRKLWSERLSATFDSRVRGPIFEELCRNWISHYADPATLGGFTAHHVGPSSVLVDGTEHELDIVVASDAPTPSAREIRASEKRRPARAPASATSTRSRKPAPRSAPEPLARGSCCSPPEFSSELRNEAERRPDLELIDLERLYGGS